MIFSIYGILGPVTNPPTVRDLPIRIALLQVMLIGVTNQPWECDQKSLTQTYHKIVMMLRPDYASINCLWSDLLLRYDALNRDINLCNLTKLSDGYTVGVLLKAMQRVSPYWTKVRVLTSYQMKIIYLFQLMTCKRMLRLRIQPLKITEILDSLSQFEPVYKEEEEAFIQWYAKTPLGRGKQKAWEIETELTEAVGDVKKRKPK